jgi:hypothetical protein
MTVGATAAPGVAEAGGAHVDTAPRVPAAGGVGVAGRTGGPDFFRFPWRRRTLR